MDKQLHYSDTMEMSSTEEQAEAAAGPVTWKDFYHLTKPGIIFSNLITAFGGFWIASKWEINWGLMVLTLLGTALVMASGCVLNNYLDRDLDGKMERTRKRALPTGKLSPNVVLGYGITLGVIGTSVLGLLVNPLAALLGLFGLFVYVWIYTAWLKRTSVWNTVVGAISGAVPPVIGYVAVTETIDMGAAVLFAILFLWQPPHFWALGIRRLEDYKAAGYQMLPVVKGTFQTKLSMLRYVVPLVPLPVLLYTYGYVGEIFLFAGPILGLIWLYLCVQGFKAKDETQWAKKTFLFSINYLTLLFIIMVIDTVALK
ncbi:heme o synthase [Paenibacillus aurantius]|uniref:Protoheme IX farnesyltransferase n=1 Tax=Paenibacillus aurantius TaxID=2918900 RepID=A0AA96LF48_9BACL|nr:heme o synthase [Paenibacillus aurantius]WJH32232.1 heme o synthase [Paenibacillus sp. CC-CFT747]WNQ12606.1 heme o synthase [Paenibacillus aurantius]